MTSTLSQTGFDQPALAQLIDNLSEPQLDELRFGVIGFDAEGVVRLYNSYESRVAGLSRERVVGLPIFTSVAPCMNNFMVAQRFEDANAANIELDVVVDFVLTWRMKPTNVKLRLLAGPGIRYKYVLIHRLS
jgi:photoactive yellow protein